MTKTKIYLVGGDNGAGNSGHCVFGIYPTEALAQARVAALEADGAADFIYYQEFVTGPNGADFEFHVEG